MNEKIAIKICEQMTSDVHNLCICCRKNEKDRTCIGCRELAIETILKENARLKDIFEKTKKLIEVDTYVENIYLGFCYLFGNYDFEDLPTKIKDALKKEN